MKVIVALNLEAYSDSEMLVYGNHIITHMFGNLKFSAADIVAQVATCKTDLGNLKLALDAPSSDTRTADIKVQRDIVDRDFTILGGKVQAVANDPALPDSQREDIVVSAGMNIKRPTHPQKHKFSVNNTEVSGTVYCKAQGKAKSHLWQYTDDLVDFKNKVDEEPTTKAHTYISGLTPGTKLAFFHKAILPNTRNAWEGPIFLIVT